MQSNKCIGGNPVVKICNKYQCNQLFPFLCDNKQPCICNQKHYHHGEAATIKFTIFNQNITKVIDIFQNNYLNQLDELIHKFMLKITSELQQKKEGIKNELTCYVSNYLKLPVKLNNNSIEINENMNRELTGNLINNIHKQMKSEDKMQTTVKLIKKEMQQIRKFFKIYLQEFYQDIQLIQFNLNKLNRSNQSQKVVFKKRKNELAISKELFQLIHILENTPRLNFDSILPEHLIKESHKKIFQVFLGFSMINVTMLNLNNNKLGDDFIKLLCKSNIPNLEELKLMRNSIGDNGLYYLAQGKWPKIFYINLSGNYITWYYLNKFISTYRKKLIRLDIDNNELDSKAVSILIDCGWPILDELHIYQNKFSEKDKEILLSMFQKQMKKAQQRYLQSTTQSKLKQSTQK